MPESWFEAAYSGTPPWDIGRPQPAIVRLAETGLIKGLVLDVGCGTGENVLYLAEQGYETVGIDGAPTAIAKAKAKAKVRRLSPRFEVADALNLATRLPPFDTAIDSGLFHVFSDDERVSFRESLGRVLRPGGTYFMMCFSDRQPGNWGPRRITRAEIRVTFADGWHVNSIEASTFAMEGGTVLAWLASISKAELPNR